MPDVRVKFAGIEFKNPIVVSAGNPTINLNKIRRSIESGAGAFCTKSISFQPHTWTLPRPSNFFLDKYGDPGALITIEFGFWLPEIAINNIKEIKPIAEKEGCAVIANIDCEVFEQDRLKDLARKLQGAGADMIEAACPCPMRMAPGASDEWYKKNLSKLIEILKESVNIPVYPKLYSSTLTPENIKIIEDAGADGIHNVPIHQGTIIDIETGRPVVSTPHIYLSSGLRQLGSYTTAHISQIAKIPILSTGGVRTSRDAIERLMCGATLVGLGTAVVYQGYKVISEVIEGLESFLQRKGYRSVEDIIGIAAPYVDNPNEFLEFVNQRLVPKGAIITKVDPSMCNGCERCLVCTNGAIRIEKGLAVIERELCDDCGVCESICPNNAIDMHVA